MSNARILKPGCLAYWDSFAGAVPCRVDSIKTDRPDDVRPGSWQDVTFTLTDDHGPYKKGETHTQWAIYVFPRAALVRRQYSSAIGRYEVHA